MKEFYKKILVAIDSSEHARRALQEAVEITRRNDAHLYVITVSDVHNLGTEPYAVDHVVREARRASDNILDVSKESIPEDIAHTVVAIEGNPKAEIVNYAKDQAIDLIVMGATGTGAIERLLVGSTTSFVVNNAPCNVMVVK